MITQDDMRNLGMQVFNKKCFLDDLRREMAKEVFQSPDYARFAIAKRYAMKIDTLHCAILTDNIVFPVPMVKVTYKDTYTPENPSREFRHLR